MACILAASEVTHKQNHTLCCWFRQVRLLPQGGPSGPVLAGDGRVRGFDRPDFGARREALLCLK